LIGTLVKLRQPERSHLVAQSEEGDDDVWFSGQ
jgi:hypothetical protein